MPAPPSRVLLKVALPTPVRTLFDYLAPHQADISLRPGLRVAAPFGSRTLNGIIVEVAQLEAAQNEAASARKLKPIHKVLDEEPMVPPQLLRLCNWCAHYYQHPIGEAFSTALPTLVRAGDSNILRHDLQYRLTRNLSTATCQALRRAPRQLEILEAIAKHPQGVGIQALRALKLSGAALKILLEKGLISSHEAAPTSHPPANRLLAEAPLPLNAEQAQVYDALAKTTGYGAFLLQGITGSGKTEVYLHLIEHCLRQQRSALVLIPEIGLTPQIVARFRHRFNVPLAVLHSGLTDQERQRAWLQALKGHAGIVIGTRSAVFVPLPSLGIIIVDEEHDLSFKQQDGMRYNARDVAVVRAHMEGVPILLGSATPSLESLHNCDAGRYQLLSLKQRAGNAQPPAFQILDIRSRPLQDGFSQPLLSAMRQELEAGNQVLVFLNRRGFAPTMLCHACGWIAHCPRCDSRFTLHLNPQRLHCHHCNAQQAVPKQCPQCQAFELKALGLGTERSEAAIASLFPDTPVLRVDRDSTRRKHAMQQMVDKVHEGEPCILLGTQMLAKGHHFPNVTLVAILDADSGLFSADFRGPERMGQLILQVAGRAGRSHKSGRVLIQTHQGDHPLLQCLIHQGYDTFARQLLREREQASLPPYQYMVALRAEALQEHLPMEFLQQARQLMQDLLGDADALELFGPIAAVMHKKNGRYRALLLVQSPRRGLLQERIATLCRQLDQLKTARKVRWSIDVDPQECF